MTSKRRENENLVSYMCFSFLIIIIIIFIIIITTTNNTTTLVKLKKSNYM